MSETGYSYRAKKELSLLKDKFKYWRIIRNLTSDNEGDTAQMPSKNTLWVKGLLKRVERLLPGIVVYNFFSFRIYRLCVFFINQKVQKVMRTFKSKLILFSEGVPDQFALSDNKEGVAVSIIIPVHNKYAFTHKCLFSIREHSKEVAYEVIIADDASSDETQMIQQNVGNLKVCRNEVSLGFLGNCNRAAEQALGKYILFLNNDTVVQPNWLSSLVELIERDSTVGMVGSKLVYPEGILQEAGGVVWQNGTGWNYGKLFDPENPEYNYVKEVDYISGASLMIRADLWKQIGGFDKRYTPAYYEDTDLAFEVRKAGYKVLYQPQSVVVHFEGITHGTDTGSGIKKYQEVNQQKFLAKWETTLQAEQCENETQLFLARDRGQSKNTLLFIDHYVPEFDKDAGSKSCFQYLKLFVKMGFNIKFIGDSYIRTEPYTSVLQQMGIEVLYGYHYQQNWKQWVLQHADSIKYVFLNRPHVTQKYIDYIRKHTQAKIIYYGHDLHYLREERQYQITQDEALLESSKSWKKVEAQIFKQSDLVLYPSTEEIKVVRENNPGIDAHVLPLNVYEQNTNQNGSFEANLKQDLLFVGGFNHPPNEDAVYWFAKEIFPSIQQAIPAIRFIVVGSKTTEKIRSLASASIMIKGFVSDEELKELYRTTRVVVAPLRYGAGVKGKIIEAIHNRCAVVTTPIGAEGIQNENELITIASEATDFAQAIVDLYPDINRLKKIYEQSPDYIAQYFSEKHVMDFVKTTVL